MGELIEGRLFAVNGIQVCGASLRRRSGQAFAKEAESGAGAIEFLESEAPELIFLDQAMAGFDFACSSTKL